ncbi:MAG: 30S ribosome-binding factor RbfA [Bryobacteraceae bacterium]
MDEHRSQRVAEAIREELAEIIGYEMADPRIGEVDVTEVLVSPDMRHARVRLHLGGSEQSRENTMQALDGARHYLRRELAGRLRLFRFPELLFEADLGTGDEKRLEQLLRRARKGRAKSGGGAQESTL